MGMGMGTRLLVCLEAERQQVALVAMGSLAGADRRAVCVQSRLQQRQLCG
jgi:hypothetical protein